MPPQIAALFTKIKSAVKDMSDSIIIIYGEKGMSPFKKPLSIAVPALFALYFMVYSPISGKLKRYKGDARNMTVVAQYAEDYEAAKLRMAGYQRKLPLLKDKDDWLSYLINNTAKNAGVSVDSLGAQRDNEVGNYMVVSREVSATTNYSTAGKWLAEIENSPIFMRVTEMAMHRDENNPGSVKVSFTLSTIFPRLGGGGSAGGR